MLEKEKRKYDTLVTIVLKYMQIAVEKKIFTGMRTLYFLLSVDLVG